MKRSDSRAQPEGNNPVHHNEAPDGKQMICIACPIGCRLLVRGNSDGDVLVTGNKCARGREYGEEEYRAPRRMVTCTCRTNSDHFPRLPVRSVAAVPKELIDDLLHDLYDLTIELPVRRGDLVLKNFRNSGVDVVATMTLRNRGV